MSKNINCDLDEVTLRIEMLSDTLMALDGYIQDGDDDLPKMALCMPVMDLAKASKELRSLVDQLFKN